MASSRDSMSKSQKQQEVKSGNHKAAFSRSMPSSMSTLANSKSSAPPAKFSERTEQLQTINSIRKAPVGAQIKRVIDLLFEKRQDLTPEEIDRRCHVDVNGNKSVFDSLRKNPKVSYDGERFSYKSKHQLANKDDLIKLIKKFPEGIAVIDLKDAYTAVVDDLQVNISNTAVGAYLEALKASGEIWLLSNFDSQEDIAYPNNTKVDIKVDDDLKQLFRGIELPPDMLDIERELQKSGMRPATNTAKRRAAAEIHGIPPKSKTKKKKHEISKRTKLTNAHLPELFQHLNVPGSR